MDRKKVTEKILEFERNNPVEEYKFYDWHVWPVLRIKLAYKAIFQNLNTSTKRNRTELQNNLVSKNIRPTALEKIKNKANKAIQKAKDRKCSPQKLIDIVNNQISKLYDYDRPDKSNCDVVIITFSDYLIKHSKKWYDIYSDPFVEIFDKKNISYKIWDLGTKKIPRSNQAAWISNKLEYESKKLVGLRKLPEPKWFKDFDHFASIVMKVRIPWHEWDSRIRNIEKWSRAYQKWFLSSNIKLLMCICWYDARMLAAILAAKRLKIFSADIQHGLQDNGHFAYSNWFKFPINGYETIPDLFWCWGKADSKRINEDNLTFKYQSKVTAGGNLWLNKWKELQDPDIQRYIVNTCTFAAQFEKCILVTLPVCISILKEAIAFSPKNWLWLVRFHRKTTSNERKEIEHMLLQSKHPNVNFEYANEMQLYVLFKCVQIHVTGWSTCAIEALSFGLPTIVIHKNGKLGYKQFLKNGTMYYAKNATTFFDAVKYCEKIRKEDCISASGAYFANSEDSLSAINHLLGNL